MNCIIEQHHIFKRFIAHKLEQNPDLKPSKLISDYINKPNYVITPFTPDQHYMTQKIDKIKLKNYGKIPTSIEEINPEDLKQFVLSFEFHKIKYNYHNNDYEALFINNDFQKYLMK